MSAPLMCVALAVPGIALASCGLGVALLLANAAVAISAAPEEAGPVALLPHALLPLVRLACNLGALLLPTGGLLLLPLALRLTPSPAPSGFPGSAAFCVLCQLPLCSSVLILSSAGSSCPGAVPWLWAAAAVATPAMLLLWHRALRSPTLAWEAGAYSPFGELFSPWADHLLRAVIPPPTLAPPLAPATARPRPQRGAGQRLLADADDVDAWWWDEAWLDDGDM